MKIKHAPFFAGINGFGRAADWLGWEQPMHCEIDDFCQTLIKYYWNNSKPYYDITKSDFNIYRNRIDVLSGGFPCQPFSHAGARNGVDDHRYLWPEYLRAIREIQPIAVVGENVAGLLSMEQHEMFARVDSRRIVRFQNYDEFEGIYTRQATMLVNDICEDLEKEGYDVQTFIVPAAGVGAPHKRDRIWFVAYSDERAEMRRSKINEKKIQGERLSERDQVQQSHITDSAWGFSATNPPGDGRQWKGPVITVKEGLQTRSIDNRELSWRPEGLCSGGIAPNTKSTRPGRIRNQKKEAGSCEGHELSRGKRGIQNEEWNAADSCKQGCKRIQQPREYKKENVYGQETSHGSTSKLCSGSYWDNFPTQSPLCSGDDGLPTELDGITFSKWRNESIKAYGNAIVPQVAYPILKAIDEKINSK